jgi:hypothetical protein
MSEPRNYCVKTRKTLWPFRIEKVVDTKGHATWTLSIWRGWAIRYAVEIGIPFKDAPIWVVLTTFEGKRTVPRW